MCLFFGYKLHVVHVVFIRLMHKKLNIVGTYLIYKFNAYFDEKAYEYNDKIMYYARKTYLNGR